MGQGDYVFNYTDHLGNLRLSYSDANKDGAVTKAEILEENNYYPFGLMHKGYNDAPTVANYKYSYNGKERQDEMGLNMYDYGARNYDPAMGRWFNYDPLAEKSRKFSPYTYALDNPIYFIDPDGMEANPVYDENGEFIANSDNDGDGIGDAEGEILFMNRSDYNNVKNDLDFRTTNDGVPTRAVSTSRISAPLISTFFGLVLGAKTLSQTIDDGFTQKGLDMATNTASDIASVVYNENNLVNDSYSGYYWKQGDENGMSSNGGTPPYSDNLYSPGHANDKKMITFSFCGIWREPGQFTKANIQNFAEHEGNGHIKNNIPGEGREHAKAYQLQMTAPSWNATTPEWKIMIREGLQIQLKK